MLLKFTTLDNKKVYVNADRIVAFDYAESIDQTKVCAEGHSWYIRGDYTGNIAHAIKLENKTGIVNLEMEEK